MNQGAPSPFLMQQNIAAMFSGQLVAGVDPNQVQFSYMNNMDHQYNQFFQQMGRNLVNKIQSEAGSTSMRMMLFNIMAQNSFNNNDFGQTYQEMVSHVMALVSNGVLSPNLGDQEVSAMLENFVVYQIHKLITTRQQLQGIVQQIVPPEALVALHNSTNDYLRRVGAQQQQPMNNGMQGNMMRPGNGGYPPMNNGGIQGYNQQLPTMQGNMMPGLNRFNNTQPVSTGNLFTNVPIQGAAPVEPAGYSRFGPVAAAAPVPVVTSPPMGKLVSLQTGHTEIKVETNSLVINNAPIKTTAITAETDQVKEIIQDPIAWTPSKLYPHSYCYDPRKYQLIHAKMLSGYLKPLIIPRENALDRTTHLSGLTVQADPTRIEAVTPDSILTNLSGRPTVEQLTKFQNDENKLLESAQLKKPLFFVGCEPGDITFLDTVHGHNCALSELEEYLFKAMRNYPEKMIVTYRSRAKPMSFQKTARTHALVTALGAVKDYETAVSTLQAFKEECYKDPKGSFYELKAYNRICQYFKNKINDYLRHGLLLDVGIDDFMDDAPAMVDYLRKKGENLAQNYLDSLPTLLRLRVGIGSNAESTISVLDKTGYVMIDATEEELGIAIPDCPTSVLLTELSPILQNVMEIIMAQGENKAALNIPHYCWWVKTKDDKAFRIGHAAMVKSSLVISRVK